MPKPSEIIDKHSETPQQRENKRDEILDQMVEDIGRIKVLLTGLYLKGVSSKDGISLFKEREWHKED